MIKSFVFIIMLGHPGQFVAGEFTKLDDCVSAVKQTKELLGDSLSIRFACLPKFIDAVKEEDK